MKRFKSLILLAALAVGLSFSGAGCKHTGQLEQGGYYAPGTWAVTNDASGNLSSNFVASAAADPSLYFADQAFNLAQQSVDTIFAFEQQNRKYLEGLSPDIKHTLDSIRPDATQAVKAYLRARKLYVANRTPAGLTAMQTALSQLQTAATSVAQALPQGTSPPPSISTGQ